jgi:NADH pyrophosphatase NudC (nudix superfamily)
MIKEEQCGKISWDIPAGGLVLGETIHEGVKREVLEEVGLMMTEPRYKKVFQYIEKNRITINFLFQIKLDKLSEIHTNNQEADESILDIQWFSQDQIREMITKRETENNLATARLQTWIDGFKGETVEIVHE